MPNWQAIATGTAVAVLLMSLLVLLWQRQKGDVEVFLAVVSGSMALSLMSPWMQGAPAWMSWAVAIGGSATCNGFWLVSRALFRGAGGVGKEHVLVAAGIAGLIAAYRGVQFTSHGAGSGWVSALDSLLTLASSSLLVLTFLEALRGGWAQLPRHERRLRVVFMLLFATCVLTATLLGALANGRPVMAKAHDGVVPVFAMTLILFTHVALWYRRRMPWPISVPPRAPSMVASSMLTAEEDRLLQALRHQLEVAHVYRDPELKVLELARRLGTAEHKLSRLISSGLCERNFNQMINRYRILDACQRLAESGDDVTILEISGAVGFASAGPFNRAFKAVMGCTPSAYRAACSAQAAADNAMTTGRIQSSSST